MARDYDIEANEFESVKQEIKVLGLGGGGCNAVDRMLEMGYGIPGVEFIAANTDLQALQRSKADTKLLIGPALTTGLGSGGNPEVGEKAALESEDLIRETLEGADVVFLTAGMGGGTGSGAISVAARIAQELGAITISVVSTPFSFEAGRRITNARTRLMKLASHSDTLITIPNDQLLKVAPKNTSLRDAFAYADDVLRQGVMGITQLLTNTGEMNVDFAHVREMMQHGGGSLLSIGRGSGPNKVSDALYQALNHPLLEHLPIENATGIIANFIGDEDLTFSEVTDGLGYLQALTGGYADIIPGQMVDNNMKDQVEIILIITGIASTPVESLAEERTADLCTDSQIYRSYETEPAVEEPVYEMAYAAVEEAKAEAEAPVKQDAVSAEAEEDGDFISYHVRRIFPTAEEPETYKASDAANAAYDTFMSPLGLNDFGSSSMDLSDNRQNYDAQPDLDIPTFIRKRL